MGLDLKPFFEKYEAIARQADQAFEAVQKAHPECVACKKGCDDCCYALFDLSLVEAIYLNHKFLSTLSGEKRQDLIMKADRADRKTYQVKREAYQASQKGKTPEEVFHRVGWERVRCPLLNDEGLCDLYEFRPITCRLYGIPTAIGGKGHTCGKSGFEPGTPYPTVNLDAINHRLLSLSQELVESLPTRFTDMSDVLVPVSMALLNVYNEDYLGIKEKDACQVETKSTND